MSLFQSSEESDKSTGVVLSGDPAEEWRARPWAATQPASFRNRQRPVATLSDIAERMLAQGKKNHDDFIRQINTLMEIEDRRFQVLREQAERDRDVFQKAMERNTTLLLASIDVLKSLGDVIQDIQRILVAQERGPPSLSSRAPDPLPQFRSSCENGSSDDPPSCHAQAASAAAEGDTPREEPGSAIHASAGPRDSRSKECSCVGRSQRYFEPIV